MERQYKSGLEKISSKIKNGLVLATAVSALALNSGCAHLRPPTGEDYEKRKVELQIESDYEIDPFLNLFGIAAELGTGAYKASSR